MIALFTFRKLRFFHSFTETALRRVDVLLSFAEEKIMDRRVAVS